MTAKEKEEKIILYMNKLDLSREEAEQLIEDDELTVEVHGFDIIVSHTTHIAAAVERADISRIVTICGRVMIRSLVVDVHARNNVQGTTLHVFGTDI